MKTDLPHSGERWPDWPTGERTVSVRETTTISYHIWRLLFPIYVPFIHFLSHNWEPTLIVNQNHPNPHWWFYLIFVVSLVTTVKASSVGLAAAVRQSFDEQDGRLFGDNTAETWGAATWTCSRAGNPDQDHTCDQPDPGCLPPAQAEGVWVSQERCCTWEDLISVAQISC